jgi:Ca-activated chloride channel homolog
VILFYLLKRKRVVRLVSSTLLWQKFLAETQANAPFQRLRKNWLLFLQLLLLVLVVLALARPYIVGKSQPTSRRIVILDASASMQATDESPSRFEQARAEALRWAEALKPDEQMMVLLAGARTEVKQSLTSDRTALRRALNACAPSDGPTRLADALKTAGAFTFEKRGEEEVAFGEIHLFSDGQAPDLEELANKNLPLVYHRIGQRGNNAGIVSLDVRANPEDPRQRAVFVNIGNFSPQRMPADVDLLFGDRLIETRPLDLAPTNTVPLVFLAPQTNDGVFTVRLKVTDDLALDNQASALSLLPQSVKVLLVTRGNRFLEKALRGPPNVELSVTPVLADTAPAFDIVVLDDVMPAVWPQGNLLAIHTAQTNWFAAMSTVANPMIVDWKNTHPLLRFVNFGNVLIQAALAVSPPAWGVSVADAAQTPLIVVGEIDQRRVIWIGFDTLQSNWPQRSAYPIFMYNAMDWLNPFNASAEQFMVRAGQPFRFGLRQPVNAAEVTRPDGTRQPLALEPGTRELIVGDTLKQGLYQVTAGTNHLRFCVNLVDAFESNLTPRDELPLGKYDRVAATTVKRANLELWRWLALAGLAMLLFEWWFYHKRTA